MTRFSTVRPSMAHLIICYRWIKPMGQQISLVCNSSKCPARRQKTPWLPRKRKQQTNSKSLPTSFISEEDFDVATSHRPISLRLKDQQPLESWDRRQQMLRMLCSRSKHRHSGFTSIIMFIWLVKILFHISTRLWCRKKTKNADQKTPNFLF